MLLYVNMNLKTPDPSPPTNTNLPQRKLCPVPEIRHTLVIKAQTLSDPKNTAAAAEIFEEAEQWEFVQAMTTDSSVTPVTAHLIRDSLSCVKMQTNVRLQS